MKSFSRKCVVRVYSNSTELNFSEAARHCAIRTVSRSLKKMNSVTGFTAQCCIGRSWLQGAEAPELAEM